MNRPKLLGGSTKPGTGQVSSLWVVWPTRRKGRQLGGRRLSCATLRRVAPTGEYLGDETLMRADHYDSFAESYSKANESGLFNAYYERPAMVKLVGDVRGRRVLDAGCGSGPLFEALRPGCDRNWFRLQPSHG